jgi:hypothetical protein
MCRATKTEPTRVARIGISYYQQHVELAFSGRPQMGIQHARKELRTASKRRRKGLKHKQRMLKKDKRR